MMENIRAVLFDLDGTVMDSAPGVLTSVIYALKQYGIEVSGFDEIRGFMGPPLVDSFKTFYGFSQEQAEEARDHYRVLYQGGQIYNAEVFPGMREVLQWLREQGIPVGVATSKPEILAEQVLEHYGIRELFDYVTGAGMEDHVRHSKTDVMLEALSRMAVSEAELDRVWMVGDRHFDILGAKACRVKSIGCYFGYAPEGELEEAGADLICQTTEELLALFRGLAAGDRNCREGSGR